MLKLIVIAFLISICTAVWAGDKPVPIDKTRIVVAPFCGLGPDLEAAGKMLAEIKNYCNAVYHAPWLFLDRKPSYKDYPNEFDSKEINFLLDATLQEQIPCILTLHWGPTGQPDMMEWIAKKYSPSEIWQVSVDGKLARHETDPFSNLPCLVHPGVRAEIQDTYIKAVAAAKAHPGYKYVLCLGGTTEPMISRGDIMKANDNEPSGFCFNPEHIKWWRSYLEKRWESIDKFNKAFGASYKSFDDVEAPKSTVTSPLYVEYERGLRQSLMDYQDWQMQFMQTLDPKLPLLNHIASVLSIVVGGVRGSCTTFDAGSARPGVPGGSVYTIPDHIADYAAIQMDGHRSFRQDEFAAIELGILGTWDGRGEEYKVWYSQMAARFSKVWSAPYAWYGGGSNLRGTDAKYGLLWGTKLGALDVGKPKLPRVAILTNYSAWSWDCARARQSELECYKSLFEAGIDRVLLSEFQVEDEWLERNRLQALVLPEPFVMSKTMLEKLKAAQKKGLLIITVGSFPEKDELGNPLPSSLIDALKNNTNTVSITDKTELSAILKKRLGLVNCLAGYEVIETDKGLCIVNISHCKGANRVTEPPAKQEVSIKIGARNVRVPVQYFTFIDRKTAKVKWIDESGEWHEG